MRDAYLCAGVGTPAGRCAGALASPRPDDTAAHVIRELMARVPGLPREPASSAWGQRGCLRAPWESGRLQRRESYLIDLGLKISEIIELDTSKNLQVGDLTRG